MPPHLLALIARAILIGIFALALWRGGPPERLGAGFAIVAALVGMLINILAGPELAPLLLLAADAALAAAFLFLAVRYASLWLGAAMIFQAVQFGLHAIYTAGDLAHDHRYKLINNLVTLGIFTVILLATLFSWRKRVRDAKAPEAL